MEFHYLVPKTTHPDHWAGIRKYFGFNYISLFVKF